MKKEIYLFRISVLLLIIVVVFACRKSVNPQLSSFQIQQHQDTARQGIQKSDSQSAQIIPYPQSPVTGCSYAPYYGDSIIFPQPTSQGNDYIVSPVNNPGPGNYLSWPQGLVINSSTGAINLTQSQTGERFEIGFVKSGTTDTCMTSLILGGASYIDSVYVLSNGASQVYSYFNANPALVWNCPSNGGSGSCQFDITGSAKKAHIIVDKNNGWIDLQKSLDAGAFGPLPFDGEEISAQIFYQLNDGSNMAIQNIVVNFVYYNSKSSIAASLINNLASKLNNFLLDQLIVKQGNPRPPIIIITRFN